MVDKSAFAEALSEMEAEESCDIEALKMFRQAITAYEQENDELKKKFIAQDAVERLMKVLAATGGRMDMRTLERFENTYMPLIGRVRSINVDPSQLAVDIGEQTQVLIRATQDLQHAVHNAQMWIKESQSAKIKAAPQEAIAPARVNLQQAIRGAGGRPGFRQADQQVAAWHGQDQVFRANVVAQPAQAVNPQPDPPRGIQIQGLEQGFRVGQEPDVQIAAGPAMVVQRSLAELLEERRQQIQDERAGEF